MFRNVRLICVNGTVADLLHPMKRPSLPTVELADHA